MSHKNRYRLERVGKFRTGQPSGNSHQRRKYWRRLSAVTTFVVPRGSLINLDHISRGMGHIVIGAADEVFMVTRGRLFRQGDQS